MVAAPHETHENLPWKYYQGAGPEDSARIKDRKDNYWGLKMNVKK